MSKPSFLAAFKIEPSTENDPAAHIKYRNRATYALNAAGQLTGLNLCGGAVKTADVQQLLQSADCQHLEALNLSENSLPQLHIPATLTALRFLNVSENADLSALVFKGPLPALEVLTANECALQSLELPANYFPALTKLDARNNKLTTCTFGSGCPQLEFLDLSQNLLPELRLPKGFSGLVYLYLNENQLARLEFAQAFPLLEILHLKGNRLEALPEQQLLGSLKLKTLYLHGNPLPRIPKGASGVPEGERDNAAAAVRNYLRSITEDTPIPNDEVKLVLLGNSTAGKSSLLRFLKDQVFDEGFSTHGISNEMWQPDELPFKINVWDFGGQEFYHATHRLFLSDNAVTLVAFEQNTNFQGEKKLLIKLYNGGILEEHNMPVEVFPYTYWLDSLNYFCRGDQRVLLLQTKMDIPNTVAVKIANADQEKYTLSGETPRISVKATYNKEGKFVRKFDDFRDELFEVLRNAIGQYPFSDKWLLIKKDLRTLASSIRSLTFEEYVLFCEERRPGINDRETDATVSMLDTLTDYLHETGVILWYRDHDELRKTVFISPQWVTDTIYRVLDYTVMKNGGKFGRAHIDNIAQEAAFNTDDLVALMQKFELIFPDNNATTQTFVAPQYLPAEDPKIDGGLYTNLAADCTRYLFTFRFPQFLPKSVMTRILCKYGPLAKDNYWKNGIIFRKEHNWVLVECDGQSDIAVYTNATSPQQIDALAHEIFTSLYEYSRQNLDNSVSVNKEDFLRIKKLQTLPMFDSEPETVAVMEAENGKPVKLSDFAPLMGMNNIMRKTGLSMEKSENLPTVKPKIYFSYAWGDSDEVGESREKTVDDLYTSLKNDGFDIRRDKMNLEYAELISEFMREIGEGDLIVVFVSDKYARSPYCMYELYEIARNCKFEKAEFSLKVLPIPVEFVAFDKPKVLNQYFDHWEQEEVEWAKIRLRRQATQEQDRRYQITKKINNEFGSLVDWLADMNQSTIKLLKDNDFDGVKRAILDRIGGKNNA